MTETVLNEIELDALQETMNISFGSAAADLAEIMDIFIQLTVPRIKVVGVPELVDFVSKEVRDFKDCSIVEQKYNGDFQGAAFLVFPFGDEKELLSYFQTPDTLRYDSDDLIDLEKEVLLEIGNILIGACIGRIFEMLGSRISYQPPLVFSGEHFDTFFQNSPIKEQDVVVSMVTFFSFEDRDASGHLFLVNGQDSIGHLKKALSRFTGG